jgi:hypothetical protein
MDHIAYYIHTHSECQSPSAKDPTMSTANTRFALSLDRQALFSLDDTEQIQLECDEGAVWITLDNDPRDIILTPGQRFCAPAHRHALVYALENARIRVSPAAARTSGHTRHANIAPRAFSLV